MIINVAVKTNAGENKVERISGGIFRVSVSVAPERGKANEVVIKLLSKYFKTAKSNVVIRAGRRSREKLVEIHI